MSMQIPLRREALIERNYKDVVRYLSDFSTIEQWDPGVFSATKITPGDIRVGCEYQLELNVFGHSVPMRYRLTQLSIGNEQTMITLDGVGEGFTAHDQIIVTQHSTQQTRVQYAADLTFEQMPNWVKPLLGFWGQRLATKTIDGLIQALMLDGVYAPSALSRLGERLVLPGLINYTRRGYFKMNSRGLSRYVDGLNVGITGVTSGIGLAIAQQLARLGANLVLVGRDQQRLDHAVQAIKHFAGRDVSITCLEAELSSVKSTQRLADVLIKDHANLDVWINNAGALFNTHQLTAEGYERSLAVNMLSPAILSQRLAPQLALRRGRIINMVSGGLYSQAINLNDVNFLNEPFNGPKAYARAKRMLLDLSLFWANQPEFSALAWFVVHPGWVDTPGVEKSLTSFHQRLGSRLRTTAMGADTAVWLATHPVFKDARSYSGKFWFDRAVRPTSLLPGTATRHLTLQKLLDWFQQVVN